MISIQDIFGDIDLNRVNQAQSDEKKGITLWLPEVYRKKYLELQTKSGRVFGKRLQKLVITAIDEVYEKAD